MFGKSENGLWRKRMFKIEMQIVFVAVIKFHFYFHKMVNRNLLCTYNFPPPPLPMEVRTENGKQNFKEILSFVYGEAQSNYTQRN